MKVLTTHRALAATLAFLLPASLVAAQWGSLSGPVLGYAVDSKTGGLRAIQGVPGSATISNPIDTGSAPFLMLGSTHAIASSDLGLEVLTLATDPAQISRKALSDVEPNPTRVASSREGTAAAFYYSSTQQVRIIGGLPKEPRYLGAFQSDTIAQMAVNGDGTLVVYAIPQGEGQSLYAWTTSTGSSRYLSSASSVSAIAITPNGDALVADRGANEVFAIWDAAGGGIRRVLADEEDGVSAPAGVDVSSSNRIYVANGGSATALVLDFAGRVLKTMSCNCTISGLFTLRDSLFRLTGPIDQTIFVLDATSTDERIVFVPPPLE